MELNVYIFCIKEIFFKKRISNKCKFFNEKLESKKRNCIVVYIIEREKRKSLRFGFVVLNLIMPENNVHLKYCLNF